MEIKRFNEISEVDLERIVNKHFNHWSQYSELMNIEDTTNKFKNLYTDDTSIPFGLAMYDADKLIGFCV